jgi:hypothetical protein
MVSLGYQPMTLGITWEVKMRTRFLVGVFFVVGCGAQQVAEPVSAPKASLSSLAPQMTPIRIGPMGKHYTVLHTNELPTDRVLESTLAKRSVLAEVGDGPDGIEIALEGVMCSLAKVELPTNQPKHFMPDQIKAHGFEESEAKSMNEAKRATNVNCAADRDMMPRAMPPLAEAAAAAVADLSGGWIHDNETGRYWPKATWTSRRKAKPRFDSERNVSLHTVTTEGGPAWIGTRGMVAFGRPDVAMFPVPEDMIEAISKELRSISDLLLDEKQLGPGMKVAMGAVDILFVGDDAYSRSLPGESGRFQGLPAVSPLGRLIVVDPTAPIGDQIAHRAFLRRLTVR